MATKRTTITDVARTAGISIATVSRVLNRARGVSENMIQHVEQTIQRLNYQPLAEDHRPGPKPRKPGKDPAESHAIELFVMFRLGLGWMEEQAPVYSSVFDGIERGLDREGLQLSVQQVKHWPSRLPPSDPRTIGRIFFGPGEILKDESGLLIEKPSVWAMGSPPAFYSGDIVQMDHFEVGHLAAEELRRRGHSCCAFLGTHLPSPQVPLSERALAFQHHLARTGGTAHLLLDPELIRVTTVANEVDPARLRTCLERLKDLSPPPTALFLQADILAPAVYDVLTAMGIRPQEDLVVLTCNNERVYLDRLRPPPPVIDVQAEAVGEQVVDTILWRLRHPERPHLRVLVRPRLG